MKAILGSLLPGGQPSLQLRMRRRNDELIIAESKPKPGEEPLHFDSQYAQPLWVQYAVCLWRNNLVWWRSPQVCVGSIYPCTLAPPKIFVGSLP